MKPSLISTLLGAALALAWAGASSLAQGPYYPVNPPGSPYGSTYTGITVTSSPELSLLESKLPPGVTLQIPVPTGKFAPTSAQLAAAATAATQDILSGAAPGVTLASFAREVIAFKPAE